MLNGNNDKQDPTDTQTNKMEAMMTTKRKRRKDINHQRLNI